MDRGQHDRTLIGRTRDAKKRTDGFMILYSRQGREFPAGCFFLKAGYDILDESIVIDRFFSGIAVRYIQRRGKMPEELPEDEKRGLSFERGSDAVP